MKDEEIKRILGIEEDDNTVAFISKADDAGSLEDMREDMRKRSTMDTATINAVSKRTLEVLPEEVALRVSLITTYNDKGEPEGLVFRSEMAKGDKSHPKTHVILAMMAMMCKELSNPASRPSTMASLTPAAPKSVH